MVTNDEAREALAWLIHDFIVNVGNVGDGNIGHLADRILAAGWTPPVDAPPVAGDVREALICALNCYTGRGWRSVGGDAAPAVADHLIACRALSAPEVTEEMVLASAKRMAFAGRSHTDQSRDAEHFWRCTHTDHQLRFIGMARAALQPGEGK